MKKNKIISLNHPRLVGFRNFLREVLTLAVWSELDALGESLASQASENHYKRVNDQMGGLRLAWEKSVCTCSICGSRVSDMTLLARDNYWFCSKCYSQRHDFYKRKAEEGQVWRDGGGRPSTTWFP